MTMAMTCTKSSPGCARRSRCRWSRACPTATSPPRPRCRSDRRSAWPPSRAWRTWSSTSTWGKPTPRKAHPRSAARFPSQGTTADRQSRRSAWSRSRRVVGAILSRFSAARPRAGRFVVRACYTISFPRRVFGRAVRATFHIPAPRHRDLNRQSHHPVRSQAPVRERQRQVRRRQPLRADRGQRVRQVDVHEDHRRRPGTLGGQRVAGAGRAPGQAAPGPVRVRGLPGAGRGHDGPHRNVVGHVRARRDLRQPRGQRRRLHARRRPGGQVRRIRRLHRRGARRRAAAGPGNRRRPAQPADARSGAGLEAARAAGAGAVLESRRAAAGRADQQPGHQHDPLAGERAQRLPEHDDHHQPRSSLPEPGVHAHGRRGLWRDPHLPRQLRRLHAGLDPGSRAPGVQQRQGQGTRRRAAGLRAPLRRQQVQVAPGHVAPEADRPHQGRAGRGQAPRRARTRTSASSRTRSCTARRSTSST